ncbi:MAG: DUF2617 family protein [Planctomycetota bacterium]
MSQRTKQRKQFALNLLLYSNPVHPELFRRHRSMTVDRKAYSANVHLIDGGHLVEFDAGGSHLTEIVLNGGENKPNNGLIEEVPCRGERCHEAETHENIRYMISTQEEQLSGTLYDATRREILDYAQKRELMWTEVPADEAEGRGRFLGALDIERRAGELLVQSFHLFDEFQMVVKTQAIMEVIRPSR